MLSCGKPVEVVSNVSGGFRWRVFARLWRPHDVRTFPTLFPVFSRSWIGFAGPCFTLAYLVRLEARFGSLWRTKYFS